MQPRLIDLFPLAAGLCGDFAGRFGSGFGVRLDAGLEIGLGIYFHGVYCPLPDTPDNWGMAQIQLTPAQRKDHRADAHHLNAVVMIGSDGLTANVKKETDAALNAHGLIKVRVQSDDRAGREEIFQTLADELNAAPIQHIGKLLVLWRPMPPKEKRSTKTACPDRATSRF